MSKTITIITDSGRKVTVDMGDQNEEYVPTIVPLTEHPLFKNLDRSSNVHGVI